MKTALYGWVQGLAVFYMILTAVFHLLPRGDYERYVRFFMGLLLILMMISPLTMILRNGDQILVEFQGCYEKEETERKQKEAEKLQSYYLEKAYVAEAEKKILKNLKEKGIDVSQVELHIKGEETKADIWISEEVDQKKEAEIKDELQREWGIDRKLCQIKTAEYGEYAVDHTFDTGGSSDGDRASGIG